MNTPDPSDDHRWLESLQDEHSPDPEAFRVGAALRKRHQKHQAAAESSETKKDQLQRRLMAEGLFHPHSPQNPPNQLQRWLSTLRERPLWLAGAFSVFIVLGVIGRLAPLWNSGTSIAPGNPPLEKEITRNGTSTAVVPLFPGEGIAGTQYQIVDDLEIAEAKWKAALIEADIEHQTIRRTNGTGGIELHLKLSASAGHLEAPFALKNAPDHGEWIVILLPKSP